MSVGRSLINSRNVHRFRRGCSPIQELMTTVSQTEYSYSQSFKLDDTVNSTEFSQLYDRYMLTCVVLKFQLMNNPDAKSRGTFFITRLETERAKLFKPL